MNDPITRMPDAPGSPGLIEHLQAATELQKAALARELHDELGGLLVGAVMDIAWIEQHIQSESADLKQKLSRARQTLSAAIDLKRSLIEELRPTLLDNVGLFAALRWHVQAICDRASMVCNIRLPEDDRRFLPHAPINLFRIVQEAFALIKEHGLVSRVDFNVVTNERELSMQIVANADILPRDAPRDANANPLEAIAYRATVLGGSFNYEPGSDLATMTTVFPVEKIFAEG
jgi:signal transduction histidine kinase